MHGPRTNKPLLVSSPRPPYLRGAPVTTDVSGDVTPRFPAVAHSGVAATTDVLSTNTTRTPRPTASTSARTGSPRKYDHARPQPPRASPPPDGAECDEVELTDRFTTLASSHHTASSSTQDQQPRAPLSAHPFRGGGGGVPEGEEEYERLVFSQSGRGDRLQALLGGRSHCSNGQTHSGTPPTMTPPASRGHHRDEPVWARSAHAPLATNGAEDDDEEMRAAAQAASRFSAMKLGPQAADMNATLTGGGGGGGLLSYQQTLQSSTVMTDVNFNDTLGQQQRAAMLLSFGASGGVLPQDSTHADVDDGASGSRPNAWGDGATVHSAAGLGSAIDDLRATLRGSRLTESTSDSDLDDTAQDDARVTTPARPAAAPLTSTAVKPPPPGSRVRFAQTSSSVAATSSTTTQPTRKSAHSTSGSSATRRAGSHGRGGADGTLQPAGWVASTRTMAALTRLYTKAPGDASPAAKTEAGAGPLRAAGQFATLAAEQAPLASLRFEALTLDAVQRRFGVCEALSTHIHRARESFLRDDLSVYSMRSSAVESTLREPEGAADVTATALSRVNRAATAAAATATQTTSGPVASPAAPATSAVKRPTGGAPSTLTRTYMEGLYTPELVLREMEAKQQQSTTVAPLATRSGERGRRPAVRHRDRPSPPPPPPLPTPDLNDEAAVERWKRERQRVRVTQQRQAVRQLTGADTPRGTALDEAVAANARLLQEYALRRPADEKLRTKVTQWLDRVTLAVLHDPRRLALRGGTNNGSVPAEAAQRTATALFVVVEDDPADLHEAAMRVMHAEEADVRARNLLERGRLVEASQMPTNGADAAGRTRMEGAQGKRVEVLRPPIAARSGLFRTPTGDTGRSVDEADTRSSAGDAALGAALNAFTPPTLQHAALSARLNPWGYTAQELSDQQAPVFSPTGAAWSQAEEDGQLDGAGPTARPEQETNLSGPPTFLAIGARAARRDEPDVNVTGSLSPAPTKGKRASVTASTALNAAERELLDFAMLTVFQPGFSAHLRAYVQSCHAAESSVPATGVGRDGSGEGALSAGKAVASTRTKTRVPSFMAALQPATLVTTAAYESASVAWLRGVNELLCAGDETIARGGALEAARPSLSPMSPVVLDSDVVPLAAVPLRLQYTLLPFSPHSPLMRPTAGSPAAPATSPVWELSLDLLDVVARLPMAVVDTLLSVARSRPARGSAQGGEGGAGALTVATADYDNDSGGTREGPHSRSQSFFGLSNASSLRRMDSGMEGVARPRLSSTASLVIPTFCKTAWKTALREAAKRAECGSVPPAGAPRGSLTASPRGSRSPSTRPEPSARESSVEAPHAAVVPSPTQPIRDRRSTSADGAAPLLHLARPETAELRGFTLQLRSAVEQSQWRVARLLACALSTTTQSGALAPSVAENATRASTTVDIAGSAAASPLAATAHGVFDASADVERRFQPGGPHWLGSFPVAAPSRQVYPFDMRHLYVIATLAVEETDGQLAPRLQRLRVQYRKLCQEVVRDGNNARAGRGCSDGSTGPAAMDGGSRALVPRGSTMSLDEELSAEGVQLSRSRLISAKSQRSLPRLSSQVMMMSAAAASPFTSRAGAGGGDATNAVAVVDALDHWTAMQRLIALESEFVSTVSSIYRNEAAVAHFNRHVTQFNHYQACQRWLWAPVYRSGLRLSYHLCLFLAERGLENLPENYVALLHPVALFVGCLGGHREMRANLPEILLDLVERAKRVHLPLDALTAASYRDAQTGHDTLLDAVAAACDGTHRRSEAVAPYGTLEHPRRPFTDVEREAVRLVEAMYAAQAEEFIRPADVISCLAAEVDELSVPLKLVVPSSVRFQDIEPLTAASGQ